MAEFNPFVLEKVAEEWIASVEGESGLWRDTALYPQIKTWFASLPVKSVLLDLGSGQGRLATEIDGYDTYIGVEPSPFLVKRAQELYPASNRQFVIGDATDIPLADNSVDALICINVLFHVKDLSSAIKEMARVLKPGGAFFITTANNDAIEHWKSFFVNPIMDNEKIIGEIKIPIINLSEGTFYFQPNEKLLSLLVDSGLHITNQKQSYKLKGQSIFLFISGNKSQLI